MATIIQSETCSRGIRVISGQFLHVNGVPVQRLRKALQTALAQEGALESLIERLERRQGIPHSHSRRVQTFALALAAQCGYRPRDLVELGVGALLHDVGKFLIPERILRIPGRLSEHEMRLMRQHTTLGYRFLGGIPGLPESAASLALLHHERMDGTGYPLGLPGQQIPLSARICILADALDVMLTGRPYAAARTLAEARGEVLRCAGTQFDPELVDLFLEAPAEQWMGIHQAFPSRPLAPPASSAAAPALPF